MATWLLIGVCGVLSGLGLWALPKVWRHEARLWDVMPRSWPWGESVYRGWVRAMPIGTVGFVALTLAVAAGTLGMGPLAESRWEGPLALLAAIFLVAVAVVIATALAIVLFNRPRAAVPPHLRKDRGLLL